MFERLREYNRTLLEMHIGMIFFGGVCQIVGMIWLAIGENGAIVWMPGWEYLAVYTLSLWLGVTGAAASACHMYRTLDLALDFGEAAPKMIFRGYLLRYVLIVVIMLIIIKTGVLNPLITFLGYMSLKVTALLQPITHKFCNKMFQEADPEP